MSITIGEHVFEGPFTRVEDLLNDPGVYAVLVASGERGSLIDVGESEDVGECIEGHPNRSRWDQFTSEGKLCYAVLYTPNFRQTERQSIEESIRRKYS